MENRLVNNDLRGIVPNRSSGVTMKRKAQKRRTPLVRGEWEEVLECPLSKWS